MSIETAAPKIELDEKALPVVEGKTPEEIQQDLFRAVKQINFYFSDSNLPTDRFFFSLTVCNQEGWVPIKTILTFKRMREFQPLGVPAIAQALRAGAEAEGDDPLLAVSEDAENVRRSRPLEPNSTMFDRSAYVKGFGEGDNENNTLDKIEEYFTQFGKKINAIRKRRADAPGRGDEGRQKGKFKGSVFVEFAYEADLKKFVELPEIPKFGEDDMLKMTKEQYVRMKAKEKGIAEDEIFKTAPKNNKPNNKFNAFREMAKMKEGREPHLAKIPSTINVVGTPVASEGPSNRGQKRQREDGDDKDGKKKKDEGPLTIEYRGVTLEVDPVAGTVIDTSKVPVPEQSGLKFSAPGNREGLDWKTLKEAVIEGGLAGPFMALPPGAKSGNLSKHDGDVITDEEIAALAAANITHGGEPVVFERMNDEELRAFWVNRANFQAGQAAKNRSGGFRKHGGGGRGYHSGGRGRGGKFGGRGRGRGGSRGDRGDRDSKPARDLPPTVGAVASE